ncbi:MAG: TlpA family protein disulfide reductase [Ardenticatenaceae bacterium]|nr:TlpA family protein disulfide reductase [Ardenticatenaceae bacterium]
MTTVVSDQRIERGTHRRPWWMVVLIIVVLVLLGLLAYGLRLKGLSQVDRGPAPAFVLKTFDGREISMTELQGKPVVVNVWASWCLECYDEAPILEQASRDHADDIVFLGIAYVDTEPESLAYLKRFDITYPNGPDLGSRISTAYRVQGVPETFFIGPDGNVKTVKIGPIANRAELDSYLALIK